MDIKTKEDMISIKNKNVKSNQYVSDPTEENNVLHLEKHTEESINSVEFIGNEKTNENKLNLVKQELRNKNIGKIELTPELCPYLEFKNKELEHNFDSTIEFPLWLTFVQSLMIVAFLSVMTKIFFKLIFPDNKMKDLIVESMPNLQPINDDEIRLLVARILFITYFSISFIIWLFYYIGIFWREKIKKVLFFFFYFNIGNTLGLWELASYCYGLNIINLKHNVNYEWTTFDNMMDFSKFMPYTYITVFAEFAFKILLIVKGLIRYDSIILSGVLNAIISYSIIIVAKKNTNFDTILIIIGAKVMINIFLTIFSFKYTMFVKSSWFKNLAIIEYFKENQETLDSLNIGLATIKPREQQTIIKDIENQILMFMNTDISSRKSTTSLNSTKEKSSNDISNNDKDELIYNENFELEKANRYFKEIIEMVPLSCCSMIKLLENHGNLKKSSNNMLDIEFLFKKENCIKKYDIDDNYDEEVKKELSKNYLNPKIKKSSISKYISYLKIKRLFSSLESINENLPEELFNKHKSFFYLEKVLDFKNNFLNKYTYIGTVNLKDIILEAGDCNQTNDLKKENSSSDEKIYFDLSIIIMDNDIIRIKCDDITRTKLLEINKAKLNYRSKFLSKVSHEFKNPLTNIRDLSNIEDSEDNNKQFSNNYLNENFIKTHLKFNTNIPGITSVTNSSRMKMIKSLSEYLILLANDFHTSANLDLKERGLLDYDNNQEVKLSEILSFSSDIFLSKLALNYKNIRLNVSFNSNTIMNKDEADSFFIDETRLKQIMSNLLINAYKFTNYGEVNIIFSIEYEYKNNIEKNGNTFSENSQKSKVKLLKIIISDTGCGLDKAKVDAINSSNNNIYENFTKGTGLGLNIIKELTKVLGGDLKVKSNEKGTEFIIEIINNVFLKKENIELEKVDLNKNINYEKSRLSFSFVDSSVDDINNSFNNDKFDNSINFKDNKIVPEETIKLTKKKSEKVKSTKDLIEIKHNIKKKSINLVLNELTSKIETIQENNINNESQNIDESDLNDTVKLQINDDNLYFVKEEYTATNQNLDLDEVKRVLDTNNITKNDIRIKIDDVLYSIRKEVDFSIILGIDYNANRKSILIVDDERTIRNSHVNLVKNYLKEIKKETYNIISATDGIEALQIYLNCINNGCPVDIILSDQTMNFMCGTQLAILVNKEIDGFYRKTKFYLVTAYENMLDDTNIITAVLNKPLTKSKLSTIDF